MINKQLHGGPLKFDYFNYYGPTETCIYSTVKEIRTNEVEQIGRAINNTKLYVLDNLGAPIPDGIIGELHIGGAGVARGYLGRETLTAERFIENKFASSFDLANGYTRLYKTGDLVRWLPNGHLEYIGRNDAQVKLRGYRIELGEIEQVILNISEVQQSCVLVKERETASGVTKYLVGYYVLEPNADLSEDTIFEILHEGLPDYMIPAALVGLESFPMTVNGKLNKRALPDPEFRDVDNYIAPETEIEKQLCTIWQDALGIENIGITDDFFKIGGNSIVAIQVSYQMSDLLEKEIKVADLFASKTIRKLVSHDIHLPVIRIPSTNAKESNLSFSQERLWFIEKYEEGSNAYHIPTFFELTKEVNQEAITYAIQKIISRHEILRSFIEEDEAAGKSVLVVKDDPLTLEKETVKTSKELEALVASDINSPFNLTTSYPIRVKFYKVEDKKKDYLLINMHHIVSDGWSMGVFKKEFTQYYNSYIADDTNFELPNLEIQYKDYANWQHSYLTEDKLAEQLAYWKNKLTGYETISLITDYPRPDTTDYKGKRKSFTLPIRLSNQLRRMATEYGVTMHSLLLSAVHILLRKYTGQADIVTGSAIAGRHHKQTKDLIGFFVNTQVNRTILNNHQTFKELVYEVHEDQIEAQRYQDVPFEKLVAELEVKRDPSRHPIFQVLFNVQNLQDGFNNLHDHIESREDYMNYNIEKFDLSLLMDDSNEEIRGELSYASSLFSTEKINRLLPTYMYLLEKLVSYPNEPYDQLSFIKPATYNEIVFERNATEATYPANQTLSSLFESHVAQRPNATAVVFEGEKLSYKELNEKSNQLARRIRASFKTRTGTSLTPDTIIGLYVDKSLEMIIGILGVLKAGGAYVPIDISNPKNRVTYILNDTNAPMVISQRKVNEEAGFISDDKILYIDLEEDFYKEEAKDNLPRYANSRDLAYIIYTSGTTGKPKGVMIEHHGVINLFYVRVERISIDANSIILQYASIAFDASVLEIFSSICLGACLVIASNEIRKDPELLKACIIANKISVALIPPVVLSVMDDEGITSLSTLLIGAETCPLPIMKQWSKGRKLLNLYGPTEYSVCATINDFEIGDINTNIGRPIGNTKAYVLSRNGDLVPDGYVGELYIGGAGIARGYLGREELTKERFINNRFVSEADISNGYTRLYRTGDLVRWLPDGSLEYMGRNDAQVKIRGYRIELGEIEEALLNIPEIQQSCVLVKERETASGISKYIVGYFVFEPNQERSEESIIEVLGESLPDYMIPSVLIPLDSFPLTVNGKLDRRALPTAEFKELKNYVAPDSELENQLCAIWQEVLGIEKVGVTDDFFKIGGNSITCIKLTSLINKKLNTTISVKAVYSCLTIKKLIEFIKTSDADSEMKLFNQKIDLEKESQLDLNTTSLEGLESYHKNPKNILLTGVTGFVGAYLLNDLLSLTDATIYCIVRAKDLTVAKNRIIDNLNYYQLSNIEYTYQDRIVPVLGDLSKKRLGLDNTFYGTIINNVDFIYHCATHMDHLSNYDTLKQANVEGNREVIKIATSKRLKRIFYMSTNAGIENDAVEQVPRHKEVHYTSSGYGSSKWVGEEIMRKAMTLNVPVHIYRLGLVTGDAKTGIMPRNQWFAWILKSSYELGCYPEKLDFPIIPVDHVSKSIANISLKTEKTSDIFHLLNSKTICLDNFFKNHISKDKGVKETTLSNWLKQMEARKNNIDAIPILKLIDFKSEAIQHIIKEGATDNIFAVSLPSTVYTEKVLKDQLYIEFPNLELYFEKYLEGLLEPKVY